MAINGMLLRTGQTVGPLLFGALMVALGFVFSFYMGIGLACLMLLLIAFKLPRNDAENTEYRKNS